MPRVSMVTRTVKGIEVVALVTKISALEVHEKTVKLTGNYKDDKDIEKALATALDSEDEKFVSIVSKSNFETLYGMTEQKFIENAEILPPRNI